jgi:hypothetical protein
VAEKNALASESLKAKLLIIGLETLLGWFAMFFTQVAFARHSATSESLEIRPVMATRKPLPSCLTEAKGPIQSGPIGPSEW